MRAAFLLALMIAGPGPALADELRVGAASVDITPPVGTSMAGYYAERLSKGVHDLLMAKAIVLERGGKKAALVSLDLISTPLPMVEEARREIEKASGIGGADVMISATHAHTGPMLRSPGARATAFGGDNPLAVAYSAGLPAKIAESGRLADKSLNPAMVAAGPGQE